MLRPPQNEENGARGAYQYRDNREDEMAITSFALESDSGIFSYARTSHGSQPALQVSG